nr:RHS repeat-associated core domain-containing protein [Shouchella lehensis]
MYYLMARYYEPKHGVFLSLDPDPSDEDDIITQNGYTYANNNPVMFVDPDGHYFWLAVNAGFAAYDGYKAYKAGKGWRGVGGAVASAFGPGKYVKGAKAALGFAKKGIKSKRKKASTGSYTIHFNNGKRYHGKGPYSRATKSAQRIEKKYGVRYQNINWTRAKNNDAAFRQEYLRLKRDGGKRNSKNYNKIESPGKKKRRGI